MLHVPVDLRVSPIHGLGVFAAAPIAKGTVVWSFTPGFDLDVDPAKLDDLPVPLRSKLLHFGYVDKRLHRYVLCCDEARYLNHASDANLASQPTTEGHGIDVAARDITPGEELTVDYSRFEDAVMPSAAKLALRPTRTGIILNTENFEDCVAFYRDMLGLKQLFARETQDERLCCLDFGGTYLMLETGGRAKPQGKGPEECPAKLRFNVSSLQETQAFLRKRGIDAAIDHFAWGSTINIHDPDGNRIGFRDEAGYIVQLDE